MIADLMLEAHAQIEDRPMEEQQQRLAVVQEALTWLGTPYHHQGRIRGAGVDCGMLLLEVFEAAGVMPHHEPEPYPTDWFLHKGAEIYFDHFAQHTEPVVGTPLPGDIVLLRVGRCIAHGAIVIAWPKVVHTHARAGVIEDDAEQTSEFKDKFAGARSPWGAR
jgi:cell wall-associated NlpC family hydrolase